MKTAPGTKITGYDESGRAVSERCITMPEADRRAGYAHTDHYACSAEEYYEYIVERFRLLPEGTATNNGTKGNLCLIADLFGDFREELPERNL